VGRQEFSNRKMRTLYEHASRIIAARKYIALEERMEPSRGIEVADIYIQQRNIGVAFLFGRGAHDSGLIKFQGDQTS
jgi:hypothetical protein